MLSIVPPIIVILLSLLSLASSQDYQPKINNLNAYLSTINSQMSQNTGQINTLTQELQGYGNQIWNIYQKTLQLVTQYAAMDAAVEKLNKINYMWSKNFKIMEVTFKQIKRNVDFNIQNPKTI